MNTKYNLITEENIAHFCEILGSEKVKTQSEDLNFYGKDETEDLCLLPTCVLFPNTAEQISEIVKYCNGQLIPITVRGGGTGLAGGALPVEGGVVLSMKNFDKILNIDEKNYQVTVEPGVITEVLQDTLKTKQLFYPPDPSSRGICFIGGNISTNAGGPKAVKYGVVKDYVLNLQVVTASGEIIWTGANTLKNSTGYNLTQLIVGSEGTLAIVCKIVLKVIPLPTHSFLMLIPFSSSKDACATVAKIFQKGVTPSALEFMERTAIDWATKYLQEEIIPMEPDVQAHLLVEVDGFDPEILMKDCEKISDVAIEMGCGEIYFADDEFQKSRLWKLRRNVAHAVKSQSIYKEEDTVVPRAFLPELLETVKAVGQKYGFESVCYGHAGDGNLHVNILRGELTQEQWTKEVPKGIREIFYRVKQLGGTISGEHGIGWVQKPYMDIMFDPYHLSLFSSIKKVFDPNNILNPSKIVP